MKQNMFVEQKTKEQIQIYPSENVVLSHNLHTIVGHTIEKTHVYLKISLPTRSIYREFYADSNMTTDSLAMSYRSLKELGIDIKELSQTPIAVNVSETCWIIFAARNSDASVKTQFWIGFFSLLIAIFSLIITILI